MITPIKLPQQVHEQILREILSGVREPGRFLRETDLARELGVSRTPIREALLQLAADGFVEILPNRGALVRKLTPAQLAHIFEVREALEGTAAELACERLTDEDLQTLDAQTQKVESAQGKKREREMQRFDGMLHSLVMERSENPILQREILRFWNLTGLVGSIIAYPNGAMENAHREHLKVFNALSARNASSARQAMAEHIRLTKQQAMNCAFAQENSSAAS